MFGRAKKRAGNRTSAKPARLHSIAAVMRGRNFAGSFEVAGESYEFTYSPAKASLTAVGFPDAGRGRQRGLPSTHTSAPDGVEHVRVRLSGNLTVIDTRPGLQAGRHSLDNVQATLISAQGGIGTAPPRQKLPADLAPGPPDLPVIESTGALSFCGVLYFRLSTLDGRALGVPAEMSVVQLNVRLAPVNEAERNLQGAFSSLVDAVLVRQVDMHNAGERVVELNKLLAMG